MDDRKEFEMTVKQQIQNMGKDAKLKESAHNWHVNAIKNAYVYHFSWMGLPIIQMPQDLVALQEIIWETKPDCIIETGIARGGSLIFYAGMQKMMDIQGKVIGVDIDIRPHNRDSIESHFLAKNINLISGSSIDQSTFEQVKELTKDAQSILVILDSMHTHDHVLQELELYTTLVKKGGYCIVLDTIVEDIPDMLSSQRPWGKGNNPKTAVKEFLTKNTRFEIQSSIEHKLSITSAPDGFLKCIAD